MPGVQALNFDSPQETRTPETTRVDVVRAGAHIVGDQQFIAYEFEPRAAEEYARA